MKKVLILASTFPRHIDDKLPKFVFNYAKLIAEYYEVHVLAPYAVGSKTSEIMEGIVVHRFKYFPGGGSIAYKGGIMNNLRASRFLFLQLPFFIFFQFVSVFKICKKEKIDLINAHWVLPQGLVAVLYKKIFNKKIKVLCTSHGADILGLRGKINLFLKKFVLKNCDVLTVVSHQMKDVVMDMNLNVDVRIGPMSVDVDSFSPEKVDSQLRTNLQCDSEFLLFVGRLNERKGVSYLIKAMPEILKAFPFAKLVVIGEGPSEESLKEDCEKLKISKSVNFLGSLTQDKLPAYYATADVFIGPSIKIMIGNNIDTEGLGLVNAEAMSCGCIVVASDLPAIRDVVKDNVTGFMVPEKDSSAIAEKVVYALNHLKELSQMRKVGREHVIKHFSKEAVQKNYKEIIDSLLL